MVSQKLIKEKPKAVAGLVLALNRAFIEVAADPDAATDLMFKQEPLLNAKLEKQRLMTPTKPTLLRRRPTRTVSATSPMRG